MSRHQLITFPTFPGLKEWRTYHKLTQLAAAKQLGVERSVYSKIENRKRVPRPLLLKRVAARTGVSVEAILGIAS